MSVASEMRSSAQPRACVAVCRKPSSRIQERARAVANLHGPGIAAVVLVWAAAASTGGRPTGLVVALLVAAVGSGALAGGLGPALTAGGVAFPAWWFLGLPFDVFLVAAFTTGALLLGVAGESVRRSRRHAGALAAELADTQRRLADEGEGRRRAELAGEALHRQQLAEEQAERALLDVIFETAPVGLGLYDSELRFLRLNRRMAEINGLPPEEQLGRRLPDVLPEIGPEVLEAFARVFRTGESLENAEAHGRTRASPEERYWQVSYYPVRTGDGPFLSVAAMVHEVTDRRRAEAEREALLHEAEHARAEAELASRTKDEFLAVLSHELRGPLQGVLGWVSLLRDGRLDAGQQARALRAIERSVRLQTQLVNDLLDVSRIIGGKLTVEPRPLDLSAAVREAIDRLRPSASARGIMLEANVEECGVTSVDPERLHEVLGKLLSNAIKFTAAGGTITVRCERDGEDVVIVVEDTGEGIAPEFLPHVFERFRQADSSSSRHHGGLGLGLAIARRLVELHGGRITAHSPGVGRGSRFTVRLPMAEAERACSTPSPTGDVGALRGRRVLVVEDDADSREAIALALSLEGARVEAAGSADEALARLDRTQPDAVVSDLSMPGADGYTLLQELRARGVAAPVIAVSGFATPEDRRRALAAGFCAHVAKPVDVEVLLRTLEHLLGPGMDYRDAGRTEPPVSSEPDPRRVLTSAVAHPKVSATAAQRGRTA
jgi:PAS domain S-box-containing protein